MRSRSCKFSQLMAVKINMDFVCFKYDKKYRFRSYQINFKNSIKLLGTFHEKNFIKARLQLNDHIF